jgi:hypothetical protein
MCGLIFVVLSTLLPFRGLTMASKVRVAGQPSGRRLDERQERQYVFITRLT